MSPRDIDWDRLDRYVTGDGTPEERAALRRWVEADPELEVLAEVMRTAHRRAGEMPEGWDLSGSWTAVTHRLGFDAAVEADAPRPPVLRLASGTSGPRRWPWRAAAGLVAAAAIAGAVLVADRWVERELARRPQAGTHTAEPGREYIALRGQRLVIHLPDRTQITLAPETRVRLAPDYGQERRVVELSGQAYFVVTHDAARPFSVRTERLIARDLGTRFAVRAYPGDTALHVVVAEGLVALGRAAGLGRASADSVLLRAGDLGRVARDGTLARTSGVPVGRELAWTAGELAFRRTRLRDAVVELGRWYDVDIRLAEPSIGDEQVTAAFRDESAPAALGLVAAALGLAVELRGGEFVLRRK